MNRFIARMALLLIVGCASREQDSELQKHATVPMGAKQEETLLLSGRTGRNITLDVEGIRPERSKEQKTQICGIGLAGNEPLNEEIVKKRMVCASDDKKSDTVTLRLADLPQPSYITVFHDQNLNGTLDFATFDLIIVKKTGPAEGIAIIQSPDRSDDVKLVLPLFLPVGETKMNVQMTYPDSPLWVKLIKELGWGVFHDYFVQWAHQLNNPRNKHSPTNIIEKPKDPLSN